MLHRLFLYLLYRIDFPTPEALSDGKLDGTHHYVTHIVLAATIFITSVMHAGFLVLTASVSTLPVLAYNVAGLCLCIVCFCLLFNQRYGLIAVLLTVETASYTALAVGLFGTGNAMLLPLLVPLVMLISVPCAARPLRVALSIACGAVLFTLAAICVNTPPVIMLKAPATGFLCFNLLVGFGGTAGELAIKNSIEQMMENIKRQQVKDLETTAYTDPLTGLYNRRYADQYFKLLTKTIGERRLHCCVAMIDIDDFKKKNDTYGHAAGDAVLQDIAATLTGKLRRDDTIVRWGGEEFLVVLNDVDLVIAQVVMDKVRIAIESQTVSFEKFQISYTITCGIATLDPINLDRCIDECDQKLYTGKRNGKNRIEI